MIGLAIAVILGILKGKKILKDIENEYTENMLASEDELTQYKRLVRDVKEELCNCQGTQFYGNTKLALRKISQVIENFENDIY